MEANEYQKKAHTFASYGDNMAYPVFGLAEETGELVGKIAKFVRKHNGRLPNYAMKIDKADMVKLREYVKAEGSDILWMLAEIATFFGLSLEEVMEYNIDKLSERQHLGLIDGEGDTIEERIANAKRDAHEG